MTHYKLNVDAEAVQGLFTRDDGLAGLVEQIVQQVLEAQVTDYLQAQPYERTTERRGYRNGFKPRQLTTRVGTLELRVPQVRPNHCPHLRGPQSREPHQAAKR